MTRALAAGDKTKASSCVWPEIYIVYTFKKKRLHISHLLTHIIILCLPNFQIRYSQGPSSPNAIVETLTWLYKTV